MFVFCLYYRVFQCWFNFFHLSYKSHLYMSHEPFYFTKVKSFNFYKRYTAVTKHPVSILGVQNVIWCFLCLTYYCILFSLQPQVLQPSSSLPSSTDLVQGKLIKMPYIEAPSEYSKHGVHENGNHQNQNAANVSLRNSLNDVNTSVNTQ